VLDFSASAKEIASVGSIFLLDRLIYLIEIPLEIIMKNK
jgi:hypothetical protein